MYKYVSKKKISGPQADIDNLLSELAKELKEKYALNASVMIIGSAKSGLVTEDEMGHFDFDYNICFSKVPQKIRNNLQGLKDHVRVSFDTIAGDEFFYGCCKKSVIRFEHSSEKYNLDLGILVKNNNGQFCRLIYDKHHHKYQLCEINLLYNASIKEEYIRQHNAMDRLRSLYLKNKNKNLDKDSFHIYLEAVNTVYNEKGGKKMSKVSGRNHTQKQMDNYSNQKNPNNASSRASTNNRANQMNPNNPAYSKSRSGK